MVFTEFLEMVESEFGMEVVDRITRHPSLESHGSYTRVGNYSHKDLIVMVGELSVSVGLEAKDLVQAFGKYLFQTFVRDYSEFMAGQKDPLEFLSGIETVIHTEVRKLYPEATLPSFDCSYQNPDTLQMDYSSERPFADLAEGLIQASLDHFAVGGRMERVELEDSSPQQARFLVHRQ